MFEAGQLLQQPRHHLPRSLRFGVSLVEAAQIGQPV